MSDSLDPIRRIAAGIAIHGDEQLLAIATLKLADELDAMRSRLVELELDRVAHSKRIDILREHTDELVGGALRLSDTQLRVSEVIEKMTAALAQLTDYVLDKRA